MRSRTLHHKTPVAATPMAFVRSMVRAAHRLGHDPQGALSAIGLPDHDLREQNGRITAAQMERLSGQLMRELDDEALGWFSRRFPWGTYGMLARASISAPNLGIAMKRWCRHHGLLTQEVELKISVPEATEGHYTAISVQESKPHRWLTGEMREFCHVSLLRNLLGLSSWLIDSKLPAAAAKFAYPQPTHHEAYGVLFNCPVEFGQPQTQILIDTGYLALPIRRGEEALQKMLKNALPLTVHAYRRDRLLIDRVTQTMKSHPHSQQNAQILATLLNLSERTLHRQLAAEGQTLQKLKNSVRLDTVKSLLGASQRPIKQVAEQSGFKDEKSFVRAFKQWTGLTPTEYRRSVISQPMKSKTVSD